MIKLTLVAVVVALAGCAESRVGTFWTAETPYACSDCSVDSNGVPFTYEAADNLTDEVSPDGLALLTPPTSKAVSRAFAALAARTQLDACRAEYGANVDSVDVRVAIAPSGTIANVALAAGSDALGACVARTLHEVTLTPFNGNTLSFDETVQL